LFETRAPGNLVEKGVPGKELFGFFPFSASQMRIPDHSGH
jgi:hypothetical protein